MARPGAFSRTGSTSPFGKLDDELPKQKISSVTKAALQQLAAESGLPLAEFLRIKFDVMAFGADEVKRLHGAHIDRVVRIGGRKG